MAKNKKIEPYKVQVGDVYTDNDPYFKPPRRIEITRVVESPFYVAYWRKTPGGKERSIALKRFVNNKKGYRLIERNGKPVNDAPPTPTPKSEPHPVGHGFED